MTIKKNDLVMCEECFQAEISRFESQAEFEEFEYKLQKKYDRGKIEVINIHDKNELSIFDSRLYYRCTSCNENWIISIPDNAWRGYFLTSFNALKYHEQLRKDERRRSIGCWIFIAVVLIAIIWSIAT